MFKVPYFRIKNIFPYFCILIVGDLRIRFQNYGETFRIREIWIFIKWTPSANVIKLRMSVLQIFSPYFCILIDGDLTYV